MAISISFNCCLKPSITPRPPPISSPSLPPRLTCTPNKVSTDGLRGRCMSIAAAACLIISCVDAGAVVAMELPEHADGLPTAERSMNARWSDKIRKCPPWRVNSLENVMPENLPRRSDRRRTDGFVSDHQSTAPAIRFNMSCYSL